MNIKTGMEARIFAGKIKLYDGTLLEFSEDRIVIDVGQQPVIIPRSDIPELAVKKDKRRGDWLKVQLGKERAKEAPKAEPARKQNASPKIPSESMPAMLDARNLVFQGIINRIKSRHMTPEGRFASEPDFEQVVSDLKDARHDMMNTIAKMRGTVYGGALGEGIRGDVVGVLSQLIESLTVKTTLKEIERGLGR